MGNDLENNHILLNRLELGNEPFYMQPFLDAGGDVFLYSEAEELTLRQKAFKFLSNHSAFINTTYTYLYLLKKSYLSNRTSPGTQQAEDGNPSSSGQSSSLLDSAWNETIDGTLNLIQEWRRELSSENIAFSIAIIHSPDYYVDGGYSNEHKTSFLTDLEQLGERAIFPFSS